MKVIKNNNFVMFHQNNILDFELYSSNDLSIPLSRYQTRKLSLDDNSLNNP